MRLAESDQAFGVGRSSLGWSPGRMQVPTLASSCVLKGMHFSECSLAQHSRAWTYIAGLLTAFPSVGKENSFSFPVILLNEMADCYISFSRRSRMVFEKQRARPGDRLDPGGWGTMMGTRGMVSRWHLVCAALIGTVSEVVRSEWVQVSGALNSPPVATTLCLKSNSQLILMVFSVSALA